MQAIIVMTDGRMAFTIFPKGGKGYILVCAFQRCGYGGFYMVLSLQNGMTGVFGGI